MYRVLHKCMFNKHANVFGKQGIKTYLTVLLRPVLMNIPRNVMNGTVRTDSIRPSIHFLLNLSYVGSSERWSLSLRWAKEGYDLDKSQVHYKDDTHANSTQKGPEPAVNPTQDLFAVKQQI